MGWFDKKTWQKRRKIKDLQGDLLKAEKQGTYVVEQGLFFAELQDMGDATMMIFGASADLSGGEDAIIRSFFDRNGFSVDTLKLDRTHTGLAEVEIIPPEEVTRWVGRGLKADGYKLIDDSEEERPAELSRQILPLSSLVRSIIILFAERVEKVIVTTRIKMNKEGNRLLHWLPKIREYLNTKVQPETIEVLRPFYEDAFEQFYFRIGQGREFDKNAGSGSHAAVSTPVPTDDKSRIPGVGAGRAATESAPTTARSTAPTPSPDLLAGSAAAGSGSSSRNKAAVAEHEALLTNRATSPTPFPDADLPMSSPAFASGGTVPLSRLKEAETEATRLNRQLEAAEATARMYKALIGANATRCVKNTEAMLEEVHKLFQTSATCVMVKVPNGHGLTIHAQAGKRLTWGEGGGEGYPVSSTVLGLCMRQRAPVTNLEGGGNPTESMVIHHIEATAAAPIVLKDEIVGILYLDRRGGMRPFTDDDCEALVRITQVFRDFPELTLGLTEG